jgi:hypothetical protein
MEILGLASTKAQKCSVTLDHTRTDLQSLCHSTQHGLITTFYLFLSFSFNSGVKQKETLGTAAHTIP